MVSEGLCSRSAVVLVPSRMAIGSINGMMHIPVACVSMGVGRGWRLEVSNVAMLLKLAMLMTATIGLCGIGVDLWMAWAIGLMIDSAGEMA